MKKLAALLLAAVCGLAHAGADDIVFTRRNSTDSGQGPVIPAHPLSPGLMFYDSATLMPGYVLPGNCLSIGSGLLAVDAGCVFSGTFAALTGKPTTLSGYGITDAYPLSGNPSGFLTGITSTQVTTALGFTPYNASNPSAYTTLAGARAGISLTTTGTGGAATYDSGTGALNIPQYASPTRSFGYTTRSLNTCFQVSSTRDALVSYSVDIATSLTLLAGQQGTVYMRIYSNSGCTAGTQEITRFVNGQTGALTVGLSLVQNVTGTLTGVIPAGAYVQLVTENNTGTPTFTARPGQETLL